MPATARTVSDVIRVRYDSLTRAEKQLADSLLENYPVSGLGSITVIAENAGVSTPTVARMVQKLGYRGYPEFQSHLHQELEATISNPIAKHDRWASNAPGTHILNRFADAITANLRDTLSDLDTTTFEGRQRFCVTATGASISSEAALPGHWPNISSPTCRSSVRRRP